MKTILVAIIYAVIVGALDLGGAVWDSLKAGRAQAVVFRAHPPGDTAARD